MSLNTFNAKKTLAVGNKEYDYYSLPDAQGLLAVVHRFVSSFTAAGIQM